MSTAVPAPSAELAAGLDRPLAVLHPDGSRHADAVLDAYLTDVDETMLTDFYVDMSIARRVDREAFTLTRQGSLVLWPPLLGQEAAQIGSCRALRDTDFLFGSYREHAIAVMRGVDPAGLLAVWQGNTLSGWDPYSHHLATPQIIIGAQTLHATGYAMATRIDGADDVAIAYLGDGAISEGDTNEAMVFASTFSAPVVFFCQNNQYAISEPVRVQSGSPLALRPTGFGIPALRVDGNDVLAVLAATRIAVERARTGGGPTFVEAVTYRMGPHTTTDDPTRYREDEEAAEWSAKDPIVRLERHLASSGVRTDRIREEAQVRCDQIARDMRDAVAEAHTPEAATIFDHVHAVPTQRVERQRAEHIAFVASVEGES
ncbi:MULTISPECIES: thiamine pyrophosphate-dependent dehydrogenase E1 component subunit alpha [unclassified Microbacterium]|uniref:thiamine pyrophosphate-dependent dehydrogenase E1 component subunit alpha n=1 Tax=unclassified Microbacterium TaxID=2609290 RepID=UPI00097E9A45|nr:thiamine pyrophosphate-dependent dehydrogenase E1 component subunit alpha [Microbacterium sp. JB110]RCS63105.1 thiamine pyrophosphate-dependent dehydrogenase E1 component subunit alpha [Microbacterium sp. JB110]SJM59893.1 Pyruvate dehydrogenase E1 component alpha subunit [Frigoribacterium sp. JB110]